MMPVMDRNGTTLEHLSKGECMRLMASVPVGRIACTRQALPAVEVVNFTIDRGDIAFRTGAGGKLTAGWNGPPSTPGRRAGESTTSRSRR
jgi:hypothetical protein